MLLTPLPLSPTVTFSDPLPLERDVLYGRPLNFTQLSSMSVTFLQDITKKFGIMIIKQLKRVRGSNKLF